MTVRVATTDDREQLFWHLMGDLNSDNSLGFTASPKKVLDHVDTCCAGQTGIAGVIDGREGIIGSVGLELIQPWHSEDWFLIQIWQFVLAGHRAGTRHGEELFAFAENHRRYMSEATGRDMLLETDVMSLNRLPAKLRLWRRFGGKQIGAMFWSRGDNVQV